MAMSYNMQNFGAGLPGMAQGFGGSSIRNPQGGPFGYGPVQPGVPQGFQDPVHQLLGPMASQSPGYQRPRTAQAQVSNEALMEMARRDWLSQAQAQQENYQRLEGVTGQMQELLGRSRETAEEFGEQFVGASDEAAARLRELGDTQYMELEDFIRSGLGETRGFLERGIARGEAAVEGYDENALGSIAAQVTQIDRRFDQMAFEAEANPDLTPAQRAATKFQSERGKLMARHEAAAPMVQQQHALKAQLGMQVAQMGIEAGGVMAGAQAQAAGQMLSSQQGRAQLNQFAETLGLQGRMAAREAQLGAESFQLAGLGQVGQMIQNNPMRWVATLPLGMMARWLQTVQEGFAQEQGVITQGSLMAGASRPGFQSPAQLDRSIVYNPWQGGGGSLVHDPWNAPPPYPA